MIAAGGKIWFTAAEIADLALPGMPKAKRKVNERAQDEQWALKVDRTGHPLARPRTGRGGGLEYHHSLLPASARAELVKRGIVFDAANDIEIEGADARRSTLWSWFEGQSDKVKGEAQRRAAIVERVDLFEQSGMSRSAAVAGASGMHGVSTGTLWNWLRLIDGVRPADRLPHLAPQRQGGGKTADIDADAWQMLKSDYLRPERPTFSSCYYRMLHDYAEPRGLSVPCERTLLRKMEREVDGRLIIAKRKGMDALRQTLPPQRRSVAHLHAMELVNIDGHKFDVFVRWPDGTIGRPIMVAIQDIYSRKFLSWRVGQTENAVLTRLAFADLFKKFGIPKECVLDNGRAFASKWISGGALTRFRFKIRPDEATGLLTGLGIKEHWALPFRGQSKPIERAFRDLCDTVSKHPAFAGAWTGNRPDAKPENYGNAAIPLNDFLRVLERGMHVHNAREGRRTEIARGRSFDAAFAESYAVSPIGKATPEQMRLALLMGEQLKADRKTGHITIAGNRYWAPELSQVLGKLLTIRFDPDDLSQDIHVYANTGEYVCSAPMIALTGFLDMGAAKTRAKQEADLRKAVREVERREDLLTTNEIASRLPAYADEAEIPEPNIIRPVRHRGNTAAALKPRSEASEQPVRDISNRMAAAALRLVE